MGLKLIAESINVRPEGLAFECEDGEAHVACTVSTETLADLLDFHDVDISEARSFEAFLPKVEHIVNAKYASGRFDREGALAIEMPDILRYGHRG
jgi:hypothetical protein